jgi:predicted unusual protein kinase regulating ubiquinone biosynthesis (AarF/ABC1/UbiB family)
VRKIIEVQHPGVAEAVEADLRTIGLVRPILARLAPELDAGAVLAEIRARISDEVDDELEAEHQRRLRRLLRDHPHVRVPRVQTDLSTRRVLVTEYVERLRSDEIERLGEPERDRISEIAFRCYFDLASRAGVVAGDPHADNYIVCPDGRLCLLDFGLLRDLDMEIQLLALLGAFEAGADWGAITAEHHSGKPASTALGRAQVAFWERRT